MIGFSKSSQIGKQVMKRKKKRDGSKMSKNEEWNLERAKLKIKYINAGITRCEYVCVDGKYCNSKKMLSFAHEDKRRNLEPGDLGSIDKTLLLCQRHHSMIEYDKNETQRLFKKLRPLEEK